ncbi:MerR family transcriptional regulator [Halobacteriovorax sp. JY17]|uniref:MerR family transcriptional regulator n=1 Tax=Halobacteriovorax sp. JY17 TaxID=2014617 RepID=UPI000C3D65D7|nr:MerR family transcriptional regulator [Halobacteriovorax sp. JY17]PIK14013.1 MAG: zinc-responsive transcriptional regulator [Halobacteriovorax sp. JY17]
MYRIKEFAEKLNIKTDTIRYYEKINLTKSPDRSLNGYRKYSEKDLHIYQFILRCKQFGFTLKEIKPLLDFILSNKGKSTDLKPFLDKKIIEIQKKERELRKLKSQIKTILESCTRNDCSLLDYL